MIENRRGSGGGQHDCARAVRVAIAIILAGGAGGAAAVGCDGSIQPDDSALTNPATSTAPVSRESHGHFFPIGAGSFHADLECGACHDAPDSFAQFTCVSCHAHDRDAAAQRHTSITGYMWDSNACRKCHPDGQEADITRADHSAKYFPIERGSHATKTCAECHPFKTTSKTFTCITCHGQDETARRAPHTSLPEFKYSSFACYGCHPNG